MYDAQRRADCRQQLIRELTIRMLLHDIRGSLTAVMGWIELMAMDGTQAPNGLGRSVTGLRDVLERYDRISWNEPAEERPAGELIIEVLGIPVVGASSPLPVDPLRLLSALELAAPGRVVIADAPDMERVRSLRLEGISDEAVHVALSPHHEDLLSRLRAPDAVLGATLMREVVRQSRGELRRQRSGCLDLMFPLP